MTVCMCICCGPGDTGSDHHMCIGLGILRVGVLSLGVIVCSVLECQLFVQ